MSTVISDKEVKKVKSKIHWWIWNLLEKTMHKDDF